MKSILPDEELHIMESKSTFILPRVANHKPSDMFQVYRSIDFQ